MSRAAIFDTLIADPRLNAMGFRGETTPGADDATILVNYDSDQRPSDEMFMVLGWGQEAVELRGDDSTFIRNSRPLDIFVHCYVEFSTDFVRIDNVIKILNDIILNMVHVSGADGNTVTCTEFAQASRDLRDDTYQTLCRSVSYKILYRETAA